MKSTIALAGIAAAVLALSGCPIDSGEEPANSSGAPTTPTVEASTSAPSAEETAAVEAAYPDVCATLSPATISGIAGGEWNEGAINTDLSNGYQTICEWYRTGSEYTFIQVLVTNDPSQYETQRDSAAEFMGDGTDLTIAGADAAYSVLGGGIVGFVNAEHFVQVSYLDEAGADTSAQTAALAAAVAEQLG